MSIFLPIVLFFACMKAPLPDNGLRGMGLPNETSTTGVDGASPAQTISAIYGRSHAVVIGINDYRYDSPALPDLQGAAADAKAVSAALKQRGFSVDLFLNSDANHDSLQRYFSQTLPTKVGPDDRLMVYFAGHGITEDGRGYLLPQDAQLSTNGQPQKAIWMNMVQMYLQNTSARHIMYIADACYSGLGLNQSLMRSSNAVPKRFRKVANEKGHVAFSAGASSEKVIDRTVCNDYDGELHGLFTCHLLVGLKGHADSNLDGVIQSSELLSHVERKVQEASNGQQNPRGFRVGDGDFLFANPSVNQVKEKLSKVDMIHRLSDLEKLAKAMDLAALGDESTGLNQLYYYRAAYGLVRQNPKMLSLSRGLQQKMNRFQQLGSQSIPLLSSGHTAPVSSIWSMPRGGWLTADESGELILWSSDSTLLNRFQGHHGPITAVSMTRDTLTTGSEDGQIGIWRLSNGQLLHMVQPKLGPILLAQPKESDRLIQFSAVNGLFKHWDLNRKTLHNEDDLAYGHFGRGSKQRLQFNKGSLKPFLVKKFRDKFIVLDKSQNPKIWSSSGPESILYGHKTQVIDVDVSEDFVVTLDMNGEARVWDSSNLSLKKVFKAKRSKPYLSASTQMLAMLPKRNQIIVMGEDGDLNAFDILTGKKLGTFEFGFAPLTLSLSPDGNRLLGANGQKGLIWNVAERRVLVELEIQGLVQKTKHSSPLISEWSRDGSLIALSDASSIVLLSSETGVKKTQLGQNFQTSVQPKLSPDGSRVLLSTAAKEAQLWNLKDKQLLWSSSANPLPLTFLSFSQDAQKGLFVDTEGTVRVTLFEDSKPLLHLPHIAASPTTPQAYFSPDGSAVLAAQTQYESDDFRHSMPFMPDGSPDVEMTPPDTPSKTSLGPDPIFYSATTGKKMKQLLVPPSTETMMSQRSTSSFETQIPRAIFDSEGGIISSIGNGIIHRWSAIDHAWKSQLFCQSGSFLSLIPNPTGEQFLTRDRSNQNNLKLWSWSQDQSGRTIVSQQIAWAQFSSDGTVIKAKTKTGPFEYWSVQDLSPLGFSSTEFEKRLYAKGSSLLNLNASAEEIYLGLGNLPIRICPEDFQPVYVLDDELDQESAFVPEDLVNKYCQ